MPHSVAVQLTTAVCAGLSLPMCTTHWRALSVHLSVCVNLSVCVRVLQPRGVCMCLVVCVVSPGTYIHGHVNGCVFICTPVGT